MTSNYRKTNQISDTLLELRRRYQEVARDVPDMRWNEATLRDQIDKFEADAKRVREAEAARQAEQDAIANAKALEVTRRGFADVFVELSPDEMSKDDRDLRFLMRDAVKTVANYDSLVKNFTKEFSDNPFYTLQWADAIFDKMAAVEVAKEVIRMFNHGESREGMTASIHRESIRLAASRKRSTMQTANLYQDALTVAWAEQADRFAAI